MTAQDKPQPLHLQQEFADYLNVAVWIMDSYGCDAPIVIMNTWSRSVVSGAGFAPAAGVCPMGESAALLVDEVFSEQPMRQWELSFPFQLRFLFASWPQLMGRVLGIVYRAISVQLIQKAGFTRKNAQTGAVTLIQRFGSALNLNVHFHGAHPCAPPCGRPAVVQIGFSADLSHTVSGWCLHHYTLW